MKKFFVITLLTIFGMTHAQVTFKPGIRAGVNFSHFSKGDGYVYYDGNQYVTEKDGYNSKTDFYLGFYGALHLTKYYTLQPELDYSRQGAIYKGHNNNDDEQLDISYISLAVTNKFTFTDKFNVHIGPTLDVVTDNNFDADSDIDVALYLGVGYNFTKNFGIEARAKTGIVSVAGDGQRNVVFSVGGTYTFDLK